MKREAYILVKSQSESTGSIGERRSTKPPLVYSEAPENQRSNKRSKSSGFNERQKGSGSQTNGGGESSVVDAPATDAGDKITEKIGGRKIPAKLKELLETGLLEGLPVRYIRGPKVKVNSDKGLKGVIKGTGILCYCSICHGTEAVSPNLFEIHAGSGNKRPSDYIYLEKGNTLRDVLNLCKTATVDDLTEKIERAIGSSVPKTQVCCTSEGASDAADRQVSVPVPSSNSTQSKGPGKITKKDSRKHKLVWEDGVLKDGEELSYYHGGKKMLKGYKKGSAIVCSCCSVEMSASEFEAHAGFPSRRKPYNCIFTSDGISLHELSNNLVGDGKFPVIENDNLCSICKDGGDLISCNSCPRSFHAECISLPNSTHGELCCTYCIHMFRERENLQRNANANEEMKNRCNRQFENLECVDYGCVLCREAEFVKGKFDPRTIIICDQCEREYHVGCLKKHNIDDLEELPKGAWLCCEDCKKIYSTLRKLVADGEEKIPESLQKLDNVDVRWRILSGENTTNQTKRLLSIAHGIFHEQFGIISLSNKGKHDLIPDMLYGRSSQQQNFEGMYCAILIVNSSVVSAAIFRIFGKEVAELPLVATKGEFKGKGYFRMLFSCIENLLSSLNVKQLVLPAADEAESMWIQKFGFERMTLDQFNNYQMDNQLMLFSGISMLQRPVSR